ncbi:hypothetical protein [Tardiphaga sp. vice304]|uniref:hypothetical protein n=1 Tax=Tardiphaga sp. vice304 TaxID=2592817 RepID=UPI00143DCDBB|nr:hypothetical protein [Tardiphaga sp. vice304]
MTELSEPERGDVLAKVGPYELRKGGTPMAFVVIAPGIRSWFSILWDGERIETSSHAHMLRSRSPHIYKWAEKALIDYAAQQHKAGTYEHARQI